MRRQLLIFKWIFLLFTLLSWAQLVAQEPFVCQNNFYFSFGSSFGTSQLHEVLIEPNGNVNFVPLPNSTGVSLNAVGYRSTDNLIYGVGTATERLYQIDATGTSFPLAILDVNHNNGFFAATITPNGDEMIIVEQTNGFGGRSIALVVVDLTDPNYSIKRSTPLTGQNVQTTDIAFDPITGILYGFDSQGSRLITIDEVSGLVTTNFPSSSVADRMGGLYFDAFGKMFGYGLYFADKCQKSLNYTSFRGSYWARGNSNKAFLALYDVHVGNQLKVKKHESWCCSLSKTNLKKRGEKYDSIYAQGGVDLINNEYIVYDSAQSTIRYLVEIKN